MGAIQASLEGSAGKEGKNFWCKVERKSGSEGSRSGGAGAEGKCTPLWSSSEPSAPWLWEGSVQGVVGVGCSESAAVGEVGVARSSEEKDVFWGYGVGGCLVRMGKLPRGGCSGARSSLKVTDFLGFFGSVVSSCSSSTYALFDVVEVLIEGGFLWWWMVGALSSFFSLGFSLGFSVDSSTGFSGMSQTLGSLLLEPSSMFDRRRSIWISLGSRPLNSSRWASAISSGDMELRSLSFSSAIVCFSDLIGSASFSSFAPLVNLMDGDGVDDVVAWDDDDEGSACCCRCFLKAETRFLGAGKPPEVADGGVGNEGGFTSPIFRSLTSWISMVPSIVPRCYRCRGRVEVCWTFFWYRRLSASDDALKPNEKEGCL